MKHLVSEFVDSVSIVKSWMSKNFLFLNQSADKSEVRMIPFRAQLTKFKLPLVTVASFDTLPFNQNPVRNQGSLFDPLF